MTIHSPFCDHELRLQCSDAEKLQLWEPWGPNGRGLDKLTVGFDTTGGAITSPLVSKETPALAPLPAGLSPGILQCGGTCQVERPCGHTCTAACADALDVLGKPCQEKVAVVCKDCGASSKTTCAEMQQQAASGRPHLCTNKVLKVCSICEINKSRVECYRCRASQRVPLAMQSRPCCHPG